MRWAALLIVAFATPALATPVYLPPVTEHLRRPFVPPSFVLAPTTPLRKQPVADAAQKSALVHQIATTSGDRRIAAYDAITHTLEEEAADDSDNFHTLMARVTRYYTELLADPALDSYPHAAELLVRASKGVALTDAPLAARAAGRVLAKHAASPFVLDAHILLAELTEHEKRYDDAIAHLDDVIASKRGPFVMYARLRRGWMLHLAGNHAASIAELTSLATDPAAQLMHEPAIDMIVKPYAKAGRPDLAAALFDRVDRSRSAERLRRLAHEYDVGKLREAVVVLRAAIARESDPTKLCFDHADIVTAMSDEPNRADTELAIAKLVAIAKSGDAECAVAADLAVGYVATVWHTAWKPKQKRAQLVRVWNYVIELATTERRRSAATKYRDLLKPRARGE